MKLVSLTCPNCNGSVRQGEDGKFYCDNCGTSFIADYDKEDVEYKRLQTEEALGKRQMNNDAFRARPNNTRKKPIAVIAVAIAFFLFIMLRVTTSVISQFAMISGINHSATRISQERQKKEEQKALLDSYKLKPKDILADSFFVKNATESLLSQLKKNTNLYYTNWVWNKSPKYLKSYLLTAKDEKNSTHNIIINIYKVYWDKEYDDRVEHYVMYDGTCLINVSKKNGKIESDYGSRELCTNSEIIANQFLSGYTDLKQLIRKEVYGKPDFSYVEFSFPITKNTNDNKPKKTKKKGKK